ncbi:hypothetical protein A7K93_05490 [Candidatus Methylacidiphilum fumarolicum]|nr:hypothetical protein A7K73_08715 [Candidatus Methylacidiphilum fumarolicum]TFE73732.1 hypothetical protein A7K93_05490 [Candidatus Methylacidiphilum fumarolicum]
MRGSRLRKNQKLLDDVKKAVEESQSGSSLHNRAGLTQYLGHLLRQGSGDHTVQIQLGADQVVETLCGGGKAKHLPAQALAAFLPSPAQRHETRAIPLYARSHQKRITDGNWAVGSRLQELLGRTRKVPEVPQDRRA